MKTFQLRRPEELGSELNNLVETFQSDYDQYKRSVDSCIRAQDWAGAARNYAALEASRQALQQIRLFFKFTVEVKS